MAQSLASPRSDHSTSMQRLAADLFKGGLLESNGQLVAKAIGLHPGAVGGYLITQQTTLDSMRMQLGDVIREIPFIYATDDGSCVDLEILSLASGFISSERSPNAWCAVQAKCEGMPTVAGVEGQLGGGIRLDAP